MIYLELILAYLQIGLFSIGGGHASIPVAKSVIVDNYGWLSLSEFTDMITISEMTPGPFAINSATFVGVKTAGILGGIISTIAFIIPSVIVCFTLYALVVRRTKSVAVRGFMQGVRPAVTGLISSAGLTIFIGAIYGASTIFDLLNAFSVDFIALFIFLAVFFLLRKTKINSVLLILFSGILGCGLYCVF